MAQGALVPDALELDHVFVCAPRGSNDSALLENAGFCCGMNRIHSGQGTANANFYFDNAYLELLWLRDEAEARSPVVAPMSLWERLQWPETRACPFGVALRTRTPSRFSTWEYAAPFLPPGTAIQIVTPRDSDTEPLVFLSPASMAPLDYPPERKVPLKQKGESRRLQKVHIQTPTGRFSPETGKVIATGLLTIERGKDYHMQLEFDPGLNCENLDFRPYLPLSIRW